MINNSLSVLTCALTVPPLSHCGCLLTSKQCTRPPSCSQKATRMLPFSRYSLHNIGAGIAPIIEMNYLVKLPCIEAHLLVNVLPSYFCFRSTAFKHSKTAMRTFTQFYTNQTLSCFSITWGKSSPTA